MNSEIKKLFESFEEKDFFEKIDLHIHSNFSDGIETPENLVAQAEKKGLNTLQFLTTTLLRHICKLIF